MVTFLWTSQPIYSGAPEVDRLMSGIAMVDSLYAGPERVGAMPRQAAVAEP